MNSRVISGALGMLMLVSLSSYPTRADIGTPDAEELQLRNALVQKGASLDSVGDLFEELALASADALQGTGITWTGLNEKAEKAGLILYLLEDARQLAIDKNCPTSVEEMSPLCKSLTAIQDNCAAVGPLTVACDLRFWWRIRRSTLLLTLSSIKDPITKKYYFDRTEYRIKFLRGEASKDLRANLSDIASILKRPAFLPSVPDFRRIQRGFIRFVLFHEIAHIVKGHARNGQVIPCVEAPLKIRAGSYKSACDQGSDMERAADDWALERLKMGIHPGEFTPERAIPELFVELHERRVFMAAKDLGLDPLKIGARDLTHDQQKALQVSIYLRTISETHPTDFLRYLNLMKGLQDRGIVLTASLEYMQAIAQFNAALRAWCDEP